MGVVMCVFSPRRGIDGLSYKDARGFIAGLDGALKFAKKTPWPDFLISGRAVQPVTRHYVAQFHPFINHYNLTNFP